MSLSFFIARRYLFAKKSHNAINIISAISVCGVALTTMALICTLSVFNGFQDLVASLFTSIDPQLKIETVKGKSFDSHLPALQKVKALPQVKVFTECYEDQVLLRYNNRQVVATLKGVDDNFEQLTHIDQSLYGDGTFQLHADVLNYGIIGLQLAMNLQLPVRYDGAVEVYAPKKGERVDMLNPTNSFEQDELYSPGVFFNVRQSKYDAKYVIAPISLTRRLFHAPGRCTSVEVRLNSSTATEKMKTEITTLLGKDFTVKDRYEQQADIFRIMKVEKFIAYLFLTFILLVACFNIISTLSMLIIDKRNDVNTLRCMGASDAMITHIFLLEGRLISAFGAVIGLGLGLLLCWLQQEYGLIALGNSQGSFIVDAYPVSVQWTDVGVVFVTVMLVGFIAAWYPVRYFSRRLL